MADPTKPAPPDPAGGPPKIVVDSDWKSQARAEKDRLEQQAKAREAEKKSAAPGGGVGGAGGEQGEGQLPPADFMTLLGTMVTQALMYMGAFPDPQTGRAIVSLEHAKFHIDLLGVLEAKTKGNLTQEEATEVSGTLNELRMRFVEISKAVAVAIERQQAQRAGGGMGGMGGAGAGPGGPGMPDLRLGQ